MTNYRKYLCVLLTILVTANCIAQQKKPTPVIAFQSINQFGLLEGQAGGGYQLQTINGVQHRSWFVGIGIGVDDYRYRGIPLFLDLRKEFGHANNHLFLYADGGIHLTWVTDKQKYPYAASDKFSNGLYTDAGFGYKIATGKKNSVVLSAGYSNKQISETVGNRILYITGNEIVGGQNQYSYDKYNYHLHRISIKAGFVF